MKIHLIGVCGTAMATLAAMLKRKGFDVQGSDQDVYPPMSDFLAAEGVIFSDVFEENEGHEFGGRLTRISRRSRWVRRGGFPRLR